MKTSDFITKITQYSSEQSPTLNTLQRNNMLAELISDAVSETSDENQLESKMEALSSEKTMDKYVISARQTYNTAMTQVRISVQNENKKSIWHEIGVGVAASFIYSFIVVIIIYIGKDQFGTFISSLIH